MKDICRTGKIGNLPKTTGQKWLKEYSLNFLRVFRQPPKAFPSALFLGIERDPYAVAASMVKHAGVSAWHKQWAQFPVPNRFLGITTEIASIYDDIPFVSQCAMRWVAHHDRMLELKEILGLALKVIQYEEFAHNTQPMIAELQDFLGLEHPIPVPDVKLASLDKWKTQLSTEDIAKIKEIIGVAPGLSSS